MNTLLETPPPAQAQPQSEVTPPRVERSRLVQLALETLLAAENRGQEETQQIEERAVYRPDSWLIQKCWEALADAGAGQETLAGARIAAARHPLTHVQALYRLSRQIDHKLGLANLIRQELLHLEPPPRPSAKRNWRSLFSNGSINSPPRGNARSLSRNNG
jgi:hypothetical protein